MRGEGATPDPDPGTLARCGGQFCFITRETRSRRMENGAGFECLVSSRLTAVEIRVENQRNPSPTRFQLYSLWFGRSWRDF